jgi:hypothetical protein
MELTTAEPGRAIPAPSDLPDEAPTVAINTGLLPTASQHCTRCGATLATDQRYCVECGERRGDPRLPFMDGRTPAAPEPIAPTVVSTTTTATSRRSRFSPGATLVAGTATLVLALGVGVLIGNAGKGTDSSASAPPVQVVTVSGGGAAGTPAAATAATTTPAGGTAAKKGKDSAKSAATAKTSAAKAAAAKKAVSTPTGEAIPQAKTPVVKKGAKGSGPGYKNGKFTGDFFGG